MTCRYFAQAALLLVLLLSLATIAPAQPQTIAEETRPMTGFELHREGLYYYRNTNICPPNPYLRVMGTRTPGAPVSSVADGCHIFFSFFQSVVRDDMQFYFFNSGILRRLAVSATNATTFPNVGGSISSQNVFSPTLTMDGSRLYWLTKNATNYLIESVETSGAGQQDEATFPIIGTQQARELHLQHLANGGTPVDLFYFHIPGLGVYTHDRTTLTLLSGSALDYIVQTVGGTDYLYTLDPPPGRENDERGAPNPVVGSIESRHPRTGASVSQIYPGTGLITGLGSDETNLYWADLTDQTTPGHYTGTIYKRAHSGGSPTPIHSTTEVKNIFNFRSDGRTLYFIESRDSGTAIKALDLGAAPLALDLAALHIEVTQGVQAITPAADISLAEKKPTFVRGYAYLASNATGTPRYRPSARLDVIRNGTPVGSLLPLISPSIDTTSDMALLRPDLNRSFLFRLPYDWVNQPGSLQVTMVLNPYGAVHETGSLANNSVGVTMNVREARSLCLEFITVDFSTGPSWFGLDGIPNVGGILDRAMTLMPVEAMRPAFRGGPSHQKPGFFAFYPFEPGEIAWAFHHMNFRYLFSDSISGCDRHLRVGMMHPSVTDTGIVGYGGFTNNVVVKMQGDEGGAPHMSPYGGHTLAHELYHAYGYLHIQQDAMACGGQAPACPCGTRPYDPNPCWIGADSPTGIWGYDRRANVALNPTMVADMMTYANSRWVSGRNWDFFLGAPVRSTQSFDTSPAPRASDQVMVSLRIENPGETVLPGTFYKLTSDLVPSTSLERAAERLAAASRGTSEFEVAFFDTGGAEIGRTPVTPAVGTENPEAGYSIAEVLPAPDGTVKVAILRNGVIIHQVSQSANAPTVILDPPIYNGTAKTLKLDGSASDADGDPLLFTVQYSGDNGATWLAIMTDMPTFAGVFDASMLPGGTSALVRVIASDGFLTGSAISAPFSVPTHSPTAIVMEPLDGQRIPFTQTLDASGYGMDPEDGSIDPDGFFWAVPGATDTSEGSYSRITGLAPGIHTIELGVFDAEQNAGFDEHTFEILPPTTGEAFKKPVVDGKADDNEYDDGFKVNVPFGDGTFFEARLVHADDILFIAFSGLRFGGGTSPGTLAGVRFDPDGSGDTFAQVDDVGFFVNEWGIASQAFGDGLGDMPPTDSPFESIQAVSVRGDADWSAEIMIPDSLLGGWDHPGRFKLGQYWIESVGDDRNWPTTSTYASPASWSPISFGPIDPVSLTNRAPVANAGADQYVIVQSSRDIVLNGSASSDPDGDPLFYQWSQPEGPIVTLSDATSPAPRFTALQPASETLLKFKVEISDGITTVETDEVSVHLIPFKPVTSNETPTPSPSPSPSPTASPTSSPTPSPSPTPIQSSVLKFVLGIGNNPAGLDLNADQAIDAADVVLE